MRKRGGRGRADAGFHAALLTDFRQTSEVFPTSEVFMSENLFWGTRIPSTRFKNLFCLNDS
jgi:hypothetical protein